MCRAMGSSLPSLWLGLFVVCLVSISFLVVLAVYTCIISSHFLATEDSVHKSESNHSITIVSSETQLWALFNNRSALNQYGNHSLNETDLAASSFCVPWELNTDEWWTAHPEWEVFHEDDSHYCFHLIKSPTKRTFFRDLYRQQFEGDCSRMVVIRTSNAGWGADMDWYGSGLRHGAKTKRPFQLSKSPWHYAAPWDAGKRIDGRPEMEAVCEEKDLTCYFLPLSSCPMPTNFTLQEHEWEVEYSSLDIQAPGRWYNDWIVRPQTWLRRRVYDFIKEQNIQIIQPCTAIHVRRGDVIQSGHRSYYSISEYLNVSREVENSILLLTDDANAVEEALHEFPDRHWMYINRTRFRGNSGGWENHIAANDAASEVVAILSTFQLVQHCQSFVHSPSTFARVLEGYMLSANSSAVVWTIVNTNNNHSATVNISKPYEK